jgi:hypothetical protein
MEHTRNTRTALAALLLITAVGGLASCATASAPEWGQTPAGHRQLVRASADRYVEEQLGRVDMHRRLVRASADRYVDEQLGRLDLHRRLVRASADRYVDELIQRARSFCEPSTTEPAPVLDDRCPSAAG